MTERPPVDPLRAEALNEARRDGFARGYRAAVRDVDRGVGPGQERLEQARAALASPAAPPQGEGGGHDHDPETCTLCAGLIGEDSPAAPRPEGLEPWQVSIIHDAADCGIIGARLWRDSLSDTGDTPQDQQKETP